MGLGQGQGSNHLAHCTHVAITPTSRIMVTGNRFSVLLASIIRLGKPGYVQKITMGLTQAHGYLSIISPIPTGFQSPHWRGLPRDARTARVGTTPTSSFQSPHWRGLPRDAVTPACDGRMIFEVSIPSLAGPAARRRFICHSVDGLISVSIPSLAGPAARRVCVCSSNLIWGRIQIARTS